VSAFYCYIKGDTALTFEIFLFALGCEPSKHFFLHPLHKGEDLYVVRSCMYIISFEPPNHPRKPTKVAISIPREVRSKKLSKIRLFFQNLTKQKLIELRFKLVTSDSKAESLSFVNVTFNMSPKAHMFSHLFHLSYNYNCF
jgi:hypothetical protein